MGLLQRLGFVIGWGCFALAFVAAAAESSVGRGFITPMSDVLMATVPSKWILFKAQFGEGFGQILLIPLNYLPGWLLAGVPAGFLLWTCRPHRQEVDPELYESLLVFDNLAKMAEEEKAANDDPTFQELRIDDEDQDLANNDFPSTKDYMKDWEPEHPDDLEETLTDKDEKPSYAPLKQAKGPHERMEEARDQMTIPFDKMS